VELDDDAVVSVVGADVLAVVGADVVAVVGADVVAVVGADVGLVVGAEVVAVVELLVDDDEELDELEDELEEVEEVDVVVGESSSPVSRTTKTMSASATAMIRMKTPTRSGELQPDFPVPSS
jgi:hypothetical protein